MADAFFLWKRIASNKHHDHHDLLWPVEVWAIQMPVEIRPLNVFQEAILGLMQSGVGELEAMAGLLGLEKSLVAFIIAKELQPSGWLDQRLHVTEAGRNILNRKEVTGKSLRVAYAFRDALTGTWLPRASFDLPEVFPVLSTNGSRPDFILDRNSGRKLSPFVVDGKRRLPAPDKALLRTALTEYERTRHRQAGTDDDSLTDVDLDLESLQFLEDAPQRGHVWCQIYASPMEAYPWLVADPWGVQTALRPLRVAVSKAMEVNGPLRDWVHQRLGGAATDTAQQHDVQAQLALTAELRVQRAAPGLTGHEHQLVREHLLRVLRLESRVKTDAHPHQEDLAALAVESGSLIEALLQWMLRRWPAHTSSWPVRWSRNDLAAWLQDLPINPPLSSGDVRALQGQSPIAVLKAAREKDQPLKALLCAALLSTHEHNDHPLGEVGLSGLEWPLIGWRNKGGHASGTRLSSREILPLADMSIRWIEQFHSHF